MRRKWTYEIGLGYESILRDGVMVNKEQAVRALNNYESRIAELEAENETIISDYEERMDNLVNIGNETGRLLQAEIGYLNAQLGIKNLTTETLQLRIAELEGLVDELIEAGDAMSNAHSMWVAEEDKWDALVEDWKEREDSE